MTATTRSEAAALIRRLREQTGLTQSELADRAGTTQSVISRLERDDYEGHTLSMLYRIGAALNRRILVTAGDEGALRVAERSPGYGQERGSSVAGHEVELSPRQVEALAERLAARFGDRGVTAADVREAIRWAQDDGAHADEARTVPNRLRGSIEVGPGDVVADVRQARAQRGRSAGTTGTGGSAR